MLLLTFLVMMKSFSNQKPHIFLFFFSFYEKFSCYKKLLCCNNKALFVMTKTYKKTLFGKSAPTCL